MNWGVKDQAALVDVVRQAQRLCCVYDRFDREEGPGRTQPPPNICDCKFGGTNVGLYSCESGSGCPELMEVRQLLAAMTPKEFQRIMARAIKNEALVAKRTRRAKEKPR